MYKKDEIAMPNQTKKICCKSCGCEIANLKDGRFIISDIKKLSLVEISFDGKEKDLKCHSCHNWNSFDAKNNQTLNLKRKSQDTFFGYERNVVSFKAGSKFQK